MQLLKFRIPGHPLLPDSAWLDVGRGLTVLQTEKPEQAQALLRMVQTINPPYDCQSVNPFGDLPLSSSNQLYSRRIIPAKKTAALAIFAASPELIGALTEIDPYFYETDRIELGRRRDYSRWMNFVELPSSARWSEIAPLVVPLLALARADDAQTIDSLRAALAQWQGGDRIKDHKAVLLQAQLDVLRTLLPQSAQPRLVPCFQAVARAQHCQEAKAVVASRLPLFLSITASAGTLSATALGAEVTPFGFLAARLLSNQQDQASLENTREHMNAQMRRQHPGLPIHFTWENDALALVHTESRLPLAAAALPPAAKCKTLLAGLSTLHQAVFGCAPLLLLDLNAIRLEHQDRVDLLNALPAMCAQQQCLLAPDRAFLALCVEACATANDHASQWFRLLEV